MRVSPGLLLALLVSCACGACKAPREEPLAAQPSQAAPAPEADAPAWMLLSNEPGARAQRSFEASRKDFVAESRYRGMDEHTSLGLWTLGWMSSGYWRERETADALLDSPEPPVIVLYAD